MTILLKIKAAVRKEAGKLATREQARSFQSHFAFEDPQPSFLSSKLLTGHLEKKLTCRSYHHDLPFFPMAVK